jgi:dipeptidyl aminopeptidase/acylaminoacyl peptidase
MNATLESSAKADSPNQSATRFSAAMAVEGMTTYAQLACNQRGDLYWIAYEPNKGGINRLYRENAQDHSITCLTPDGFEVRSRVHEYGGLSWCLISDDEWVFVHQKDQQLYLQSTLDTQPDRLTDRPDSRFAEPVYCQAHQAIIAIEEIHQEDQEPENRLVKISLEKGDVTVLHEGYDFYSGVAVSPCGSYVSFIAWQHPNQPWTATHWLETRLSPEGEVVETHGLAGFDQAMALLQPRYTHTGERWVISDHEGWWNLYRYHDQALEPVWRVEADCASSPWQVGQVSYLTPEQADSPAYVITVKQAQGALVAVTGSNVCGQFASDWQHFSALASSKTHLYAVAASETALSNIIAVEKQTGSVSVLTDNTVSVPASNIARPLPITVTHQSESVHGFFYPPSNNTEGEPPPLVVFLHGGPTACTYPVLNPKIQYWAGQGFAVVDINYRGSSGHGRDYRMALKGQWGISDVEDCQWMVDELIARGWVNPKRVFIRGSSAGGFTALAALAFTDRFAAGASLYGVTDPLALTKATHKFESRYLDWLIGDPYRDVGLYAARAPFAHSDRITVPVLFLQGEQDRVVVPEQTREMVRLLQQRVRVEVHYYEDEGHGFRAPLNQIDALEREHRFYCSVDA